MKSIYVEISLIVMFLTGIAQWDIFNIGWEQFTFLQALHIIGSIIISAILIIPFVNMHVFKYRKNIISKKRDNRGGMFLGIVLFFITISGFYLFFIGNRGGDTVGIYSFYIHLFGSFLLMFFLWQHTKFSKLHIKKWHRLKKQFVLASIAIFLIFTPSLSHSSVSSSALYLTKDKQYIYSANLDGGSVSKIDAKSGKKIFEKVLGSDIRRIAFNGDESIYGVTDYIKNKVYFLNKDNKIIKEIETKNRPHAIIYDEKNRYFYVTIYEDSEILVIDSKNFNIIKTVKTLETPRGMALTDDGRVLVTHTMIGAVSIYENKSFSKLKTITLHSTQDKDEFVSQGVPRLLDDIEIRPDGSEAWIPHVLWNFDHSFQFQSTIFPTLSIISLEKGFEQELEQERKHLFKSINILNNKNETMIVSNPWDLAFSNDGGKAFVTLAGSEDIMVFNLERSSSNSKIKRHRKRANVSGSGAKATQILRAYPNGTNPQAILAHPDNDNIYVQNASTLDMTLLESGGEHAFAEITLQKESFSKLVEKDPLPTFLREGKRLFNNANSDFNSLTPMSGDFWMSCNSCHFEGFNFTNRYLFKDTKLDKSKKTSIGHDNLNGFISKTPLAD